MKERNEKKAGGGISPELVAEAKAGDQAAFAELYELTSAELYRSVRSMVRDEDLAWDILQDSYVRAWRGLNKLEGNEAFLPWLRRIAVNVTATQMAQKRPLTFTELAADEDDREPDIPDLSIDTQPELALDRKETSRLVREILIGLPEEQQLIVGMRYYQDMPISEIAETLHISTGTVKAQLFKGRKKVEACVRALEKKGVKLYGLSPLPFLMALLRRLEPAAQAEQKALSSVLAEASAAGTVRTVTAVTAGQAFLHGLGAKLLAGGLAVAVLVGGKLGYDALKRGADFGIEQPPVTEATESVEHSTEPASAEAELPSDTAAPAPSSEAPEPSGSGMVDPSAGPEILYTGDCGLSLNWGFDPDTGVLTISGLGEMYDYGSRATLSADTPWTSFRGEITEVLLAEGVSSIGAEAFRGCEAMTAITIPDGVTVIGDAAFASCRELAAVTIPEGVVSIGAKAFYDCDSLLTVSVPKSVELIGAGAFAACDQLISAELPNSVSQIEEETFAGCGHLAFLRIPENVTAIGSRAFLDCAELTAAVIPEGAASIGEQAFQHCDGLSAAVILSRSAVTGLNAFDDCSNLTIYGFTNSLSSFYAAENNIPFQSLDEVGEAAIPGYREDRSFLSEGDSKWKVESIRDGLWVARMLDLYQDGSLYYREGELFSKYYPRCLEGVWRTEEDGTLLLTCWQSPFTSNNRPADYRATAADAPADSRTARFFCEYRGNELLLMQQYEQGFFDDLAGTKLDFRASALTIASVSEEELRALEEQYSAERERLAQSQIASELNGFGGWMSIRGIGRSGERYAARVVCTAALTVSEAELSQARQSRRITLLGQDYFYAESADGNYGKVYAYRQNGKVNWNDWYQVKRAGDRYFFVNEADGEVRRIETEERSSWLWLEPETPIVFNSDETDLPRTLDEWSGDGDWSCSPLWEETTGALYLWIDMR